MMIIRSVVRPLSELLKRSGSDKPFTPRKQGRFLSINVKNNSIKYLLKSFSAV
jgi:hypothetical protein